MQGKQLLIAQILYGAGLRLMELARLRVKDIDFGSGLIFVRASKGDKDRSTILPGAVREPLQQRLTEVKALHNQDLAKCRNDHDLYPCHAGHDDSAEKPAGSPPGRIAKIRRVRRCLKDYGIVDFQRRNILAAFLEDAHQLP